jgi:hypothetical protein
MITTSFRSLMKVTRSWRWSTKLTCSTLMQRTMIFTCSSEVKAFNHTKHHTKSQAST